MKEFLVVAVALLILPVTYAVGVDITDTTILPTPSNAPITIVGQLEIVEGTCKECVIGVSKIYRRSWFGYIPERYYHYQDWDACNDRPNIDSKLIVGGKGEMPDFKLKGIEELLPGDYRAKVNIRLDCQTKGILTSTTTDFSVGSDGTLKADAVQTQNRAMSVFDRISEWLGRLFAA